MGRVGQFWHRTFSGLPGTFWVLWVGSFINRAGGFVLTLLAIYLTQARGFSASSAGLVVSCYGAGSIFASPAGGWLADHLGRRRTMLLALFSASACMAALGLMRSLSTITLLVFVLGFCTDLLRPAVSAIMSDVVKPDDRMRAFSVLYWSFNLGFAVAPVLGGLLARRGYGWVFLGDALTTGIYGMIAWWKVPETRPGVPAEAEGRPRERPAPSGALQDPVLLTFCLLGFLNACISFQSFSTLPMVMAGHGISTEMFGLVIGANGLLVVVLQPFSNGVVTRFARGTTMAVSCGLWGLGFMLCAWARTPLAYLGTVAVWTLGEIISAPISSAIVADLAPPHARGRYQGTYFMAWGVAMFAGPAVGGWVLDHGGENRLWLACGALGAVLVLAHLAIAPARRVRMAHLRTLGQETSSHAD